VATDHYVAAAAYCLQNEYCSTLPILACGTLPALANTGQVIGSTRNMATNSNSNLPAFAQAALIHGATNPATAGGGSHALPPSTHVLALGSRAPSRLTGRPGQAGANAVLYAALANAVATAPAPGLTVGVALAMCQATGNPGFLGYALMGRTTKQGQVYSWLTAAAPAGTVGQGGSKPTTTKAPKPTKPAKAKVVPVAAPAAVVVPTEPTANS
jgi:hypothetical protein